MSKFKEQDNIRLVAFNIIKEEAIKELEKKTSLTFNEKKCIQKGWELRNQYETECNILYFKLLRENNKLKREKTL